MIVLSSAIGAIAVSAAVALPELLDVSRSEAGPTLLLHLPALVVAAVGAYALGAMLLTMATLLAGLLRVRHHLGSAAPDGARPRRDWLVALGSGGFRQLAPKLSPVLAQSAAADERIALETGFSASEMRREITRLHYISLARSHFFSALIMLAGVVALGLAQDHGPLPILSGAIPTTSAVLILAGLMLLACLGRIAIDVTAEPLLETISQLPAERAEIRLLRRAVELLETARAAPAPGDDSAPASTAHQPERLVGAIEQGHRALLDALGRLSANTRELGAVLRSQVERLETTVQTIAKQPPGGDHSQTDAAGFPELQATIAELTAVLQRLSAVPEDDAVGSERREAEPASRLPAPRVARELRKLLQEIEAAR
jgi:hypothetical protein